jgi:hypothetical protein
MADSLNELLAQVERERHLLDALPAVHLDAARLDQIRAAVRAAAHRQRRVVGLWRGTTRVAAVAAALVAALLLRAPLSSREAGASAPEADAYIASWMAAGDESAEQLHALVSDPWKSTPEVWQEGATLDGVLEGLDDAFGAG